MKIIIGVPATKGNFFPRDREIERIYRSLQDGNNIYLSAPRRVGKTSIMNHLQDRPRAGYQFIHDNFESCNSMHAFFQQLVAVIQSNGKRLKFSQKLLRKIESIAQLLESLNIEGYGFKVEAKGKSQVDWIGSLRSLLHELQTGDNRLVIMIDEFPQVVLNIIQHENPAAAAHFLHMHRQLRQTEANRNISFIYTGSNSIHHAVSMAADLKTVNDFDVVRVDPLTREEALKMASLIQKEYTLPLSSIQLEILVDRIEWLVPYHIQLLMKEVRELRFEHLDGDPVAIVDRAFENLLNIGNKTQFDLYFDRIPRIFPIEEERRFAYGVLQNVGGPSIQTYPMLADLANASGCLSRCGGILEAMEIDGYIVCNHLQGTYHFRSPILKAWWNRHERKKHA